jgi:DNA repair exonuclease SbcCD ATPase subunit
VRQDNARALEYINAKTDTALASMEKKIANQEWNMSASALQNRVDPINRSYESIVSLERNLTETQRERNKSAKLNNPDTEDLASLDSLIERDKEAIKKAKDKLRKRLDALVHDAQTQQVELDDLVEPELDFWLGPA